MLKKIVLVLLAFVVFACNKTEEKKTETVKAPEITEVKLDDLLADYKSYVGKTVKLEGTIVHTCKHGGKRAHVIGTDPEAKLRLEVTDKVEKFNKDMEGSTVKAEGVVMELIIDEAYLAKWEKEMKEQGESKQELHEGHKKEHEHMTEQEENMAKIANYRKQLAEGNKTFLEYHWVDCTKYELAETK